MGFLPDNVISFSFMYVKIEIPRKLRKINSVSHMKKTVPKLLFFLLSYTHGKQKKKSPGKNTDGKINGGTQVLPG